jgi:hypothetical protein
MPRYYAAALFNIGQLLMNGMGRGTVRLAASSAVQQ